MTYGLNNNNYYNNNYSNIHIVYIYIYVCIYICMGFPGVSVGKNLPAYAGDISQIPGLGRFPGERNGNPLQYSCLGKPMDRGAWQAIVHKVAKELAMTQQLNKSNNESNIQIYIYTHIYISLFCIPETNTILQTNYVPIKIKKSYRFCI